MPYRVQKIEDFVQQLESGDLKLRVRVLEVLKADILFYFFDVVLSTCIQMNWVWFECLTRSKIASFHIFVMFSCSMSCTQSELKCTIEALNWSFGPCPRLRIHHLYSYSDALSLSPSFLKSLSEQQGKQQYYRWQHCIQH